MNPGSYTYPYPRPMVTVDALLLSVKDGALNVLLIQRKNDPWKGMWAIPGGFLEMDEGLEVAAARELAEEAGVTNVPLVQFGTFGDVDRDPRGRVITAAYLAIVDWRGVHPAAADDATDVKWHRIDQLPPPASDHSLIIKTALKFLKTMCKAGEIADILPPTILSADFEAVLPGR